MKKILSLLLVMLLAGGCSSMNKEVTEADTVKKDETTDTDETAKITVNEEALAFKEEYESLNGLQDIKYPDEVYRTVTIDEDNPYVLTTIDELVDMIDEDKTFYVYFGDPKCPWCRSNIETAVAKAKEDGIETIYYIHMWDDERNEIIRDKYEVVDGLLKETVEAADGYDVLLDVMDEYLNEYIVQDEDGNSYDTQEKRIVLPSYVHFVDGEVDKYSEGTAIDQSDSHGALSEKILDEQEEQFDTFFNQNKACSLNSKGC